MTAIRMAATVLTAPVYSLALAADFAVIVDGVDRHLGGRVVQMLVGIDRPRLGRDVRGDVLSVFVAQAAGVQIGHRVADDAGKCVHARRAGAVVPGRVAPQGTGLLVADLHALSVRAVARRAPLRVHYRA